MVYFYFGGDDQGWSSFTSALTQRDASKTGITDLAYTLGLRKLKRREMIDVYFETDPDDHSYKVARVTDTGWDWIEENEDRFTLKKPVGEPPDSDNDVPF